ncbi:unnamed protein product [Adineta ricciae]|uniref:F-box domain-containing protein n=3 Tax=Adineta ricciae TaxID=249248 RepID=A0A815B3S7_ADIRI|nr:unnamed protein product [Adineta ricciae]
MFMLIRSFDVNFNDLPDEILLMIFQFLNYIDIVYSFYNLNDRFNRIIRDPVLTRCFKLVKKSCNHTYQNGNFSNMMLNRLCLEILPSIGDHIHEFILDSSSMQQILHATFYRNLAHLSLSDLRRETIEWLFTDEKLCRGVFRNQIQTLRIKLDDIDDDATFCSISYICENIFTVFHSLLSLELDESAPSIDFHHELSFEDIRVDHFRCSTLSKLKINVSSFEDCLHLFDGRFDQLQSVDINVCRIRRSELIPKQIDLPRMKHFFISCSCLTYYFEEEVLPLLHRMSNLEKLKMCFQIDLSRGFLDLNYFDRNILCSLPKLNQLSFFIHSNRLFPNEEELAILETLEERFHIDPGVGITSYGEYFSEERTAQYHLYSSPSFNEYFCGISNRFPGGAFPYVREVSLFDTKPFEEEFFRRIVQSFPRMETLSVVNLKAENHEEDNQEDVSAIQYNHLVRLVLLHTHDHYIEQFLLESKSNLVEKVSLFVKYQSLKRITDNFTRDQTRVNCFKVNHLYFPDYDHSDDLHKYFPYAKIDECIAL